MALTKVSYSMVDGASINVLDYGADPSGADDSTSAIQNALNAIGSSGGIVYLPAGTYLISSALEYDKPSTTILGAGFGDNSTNSGTTITTASDITALRCFQQCCQLRNINIIQTGASGTSVGIDLTAGATPSSPSFETSSYFTINNVVVKGFHIGIDAQSMSGNDGGWLHQYDNLVLAGPGKLTSGSRGLIIDSNSAQIMPSQIRGFEYGIEQKGSKMRFDLELSGCAIGWYSNGAKFSTLSMACEANDQDVDFNSDANNTQNTVNILFSDGTITAGDVANSFQNVLIYNGRIYNAYITGANVNVAGMLAVNGTGGGGVTIQRQSIPGGVATIEKVAATTGRYLVTLPATVSVLGVSATLFGINNMRVNLANTSPASGVTSGNTFEIQVREYNTTNLIDLPAASDQGVNITLVMASTQAFSTP